MTSPRTAQRLSRILSMLPWVIANQGATVAAQKSNRTDKGEGGRVFDTVNSF